MRDAGFVIARGENPEAISVSYEGLEASLYSRASSLEPISPLFPFSYQTFAKKNYKFVENFVF